MQTLADATSVEAVLRWDVESWRPALAFWERRVAGRSFERGLEIGAREGGISLWLAERCAEVVCSDLRGPLDVARSHHAPHGVANVRYEVIDARAIPYREAFDVIAFKSVIGAVGGIGAENLADQQLAFDEMYAALKPGGILLFAENLAASALHQSLRRRFNSWAANWRYVTMDEMREFLHRFSDVELRATGVTAALGRSERQRLILARADRMMLNRVVPQAWRYIAYGWAVK